MGNIFGDIGRSGAVPDLLNRLRQSRQDTAAGEQAAATEIRAQAGEERAQGTFESNIETAGITREGLEQQRNLKAIELKNAEEQRNRDEKMIDFADIEKKDPFIADMLRSRGGAIDNGDGTFSARAGTVRDIMDKSMKNPEFKEQHTSQALTKAQFAKDRLTTQVEELEAAAAQSGKPLEQNKEYVAAKKQLEGTKATHQALLAEAHKWKNFKNKLIEGGRYTTTSIDKYWPSGKSSDLVRVESAAEIKARTGGGKGGGLKAADENVIRNTVAGFFGGHFDPVSNSFKGIKGDEKKVAAVQERAAKLRRTIKGITAIEAATQAGREFGIEIEKVGPATEEAGKPLDQANAQKFLAKAGGDKTKARELAKAAGFSF